MNIPAPTRDRANEILYLWKVGAQNYTEETINLCLYVTGDLEMNLDSIVSSPGTYFSRSSQVGKRTSGTGSSSWRGTAPTPGATCPSF